MNAIRRKRPALAVTFAALALILTVGIVGAGSSSAAPDALPNDNFTLHLDVPHGARIDYLRLFFYDTSSANSEAWVTTYDAQGAFSDITDVSSSGTSGYGTTLSSYVGHIVDTEDNAYVLNWRANQLGKGMRLCGLRVAYRLPVGAGWSSFHYFFAAGSTMQPRDSGTRWFYSGAGCVSVLYQDFLPLVMKR
jgi:hypothetical protein